MLVANSMRFDVLTIFPDLVHSYAEESIVGRGQAKQKIRVVAHNLRDYAPERFGRVDDKPYGGGPGMILQVEPIYKCLKSIDAFKKKKSKVILLDPAGKKFDQKMAEKFSRLDRLVLVAGRYEGFDARIFEFVNERVSVGDYVLAGGELPALTIIEATARLVPGVLGNEESLAEESHGATSKEYPQYTRPENFMGRKVPSVLLSGDHKKIAEWRQKKSK